MMRNFTRLFPMAFIAWYARRNCQVFEINGKSYVQPFKDVLILKAVGNQANTP